MSVTAPPRTRRRNLKRPHSQPRLPNAREDMDPFAAIASAYAQRETRRFQGAGVRIGNSDVVHAKDDVPWLLGLTLPAPACHAGFSVDLARRTPARGDVTCRRCRSVRHGTYEPRVSGQLALF